MLNREGQSGPLTQQRGNEACPGAVSGKGPQPDEEWAGGGVEVRRRHERRAQPLGETIETGEFRPEQDDLAELPIAFGRDFGKCRNQRFVAGRDRSRRGGEHNRPRVGKPALGRAEVFRTARSVGTVAPRDRDLALRIGALLGMLGGLRRAFEGDLRRLVATGVAEHLTAELERIGMRLQGEGAIERQQRPILIAEFIRDVAQLMPDEREVRVDLDRPLQLGQRVLIAAEFGERRAAESEREPGLAEGGSGTVGKLQRLFGSSIGTQQLEVFGPARFHFWFGREQFIVRGLRISHPPLAREPARPRQGALAACIGKQIVRRGRTHGAQIYPEPTRWLGATGVSTFLPR